MKKAQEIYVFIRCFFSGFLLLLWFSLPAEGTVSKREFLITFSNDLMYTSATDDAGEAPLKPHINAKKKASAGRLIRFSNLGEWIKGDEIQIIDAKLQLYYYDEYWTKLIYHVNVSRSIDGTTKNIAKVPESVVEIYGDKWSAEKKTPRPSWIDFPIKPETVQLWLQDEDKNKGLVIHVGQLASKKSKYSPEPLSVMKDTKGGLGPYFRSCTGPINERPRLVVRYRVNGNAPPSSPVLGGIPKQWAIYQKAELGLKTSIDPNNDSFFYEVETAFGAAENDLTWSKGSAEVINETVKWNFGKDWGRFGKSESDKQDAGLWLRIRAIDEHGATSRWDVAGPYIKAERPITVWGTHGNRKIWPDMRPVSEHGAPVKIQSACNEWEPFQIVVMSHAGLVNARIEAGVLSDDKGHEIATVTVFREHYMPVAETPNETYGKVGMVPDALVPLIHPITGEPTGGKYGGASFNIPAGKLEAFWVDVYVPKDSAPGLYRGEVKVMVDGLDAVKIPIRLEVFDFVLPSPKHLVGFFQIGEDAIKHSHAFYSHSGKTRADVRKLAHVYEEMLHKHYMNNWSPITGYNYGSNGVKIKINSGKVVVDWTAYDKLIGPYMDGLAFKDNIPAQVLFIPYWLPVKKAKGDGWARRVNKFNYKKIDLDLFAMYIAEVQHHMEEKGWLDRAYVFYFDEPFLQKWKYEAFINVAKVIRKAAPKMRILITDGYKGENAYKKFSHIKEPITPYVDVWDPVTFQVRLKNIEFYRERKKKGNFDIWCQTLGNANTRVPLPNLFPEFDMPFHRIWGAMSWNFGFQGIEWWSTIFWWNNKKKMRIDPWTDPVAFPSFNKPLNCDGRLFYSGTPDAIGGPDIPVSSLRMKALREAIEDYEYFYLLDKLGAEKDEFDINILHTVIGKWSKQMKRPMTLGGFTPKNPAWQWWEGDPDRMMEIRENVARLIMKMNASIPD